MRHVTECKHIRAITHIEISNICIIAYIKNTYQVLDITLVNIIKNIRTLELKDIHPLA